PEREEHPGARMRIEVRVATESRDRGPRQVEREALRSSLKIYVTRDVAFSERQIDAQSRDLQAVPRWDRRSGGYCRWRREGGRRGRGGRGRTRRRGPDPRDEQDAREDEPDRKREGRRPFPDG